MTIIREKIKEQQSVVQSRKTLRDVWIEEYESVNLEILEKTEKIREDIKIDSKIDNLHLFEESLRQTQLHAKWFDLLAQTKREYRKIKANQQKAYLTLWKYYQGKTSPEFNAKFGIMNEKILKSDVEKYIEADDAWLKIKEVVQNQFALVELIENMLENIKQRGFAIKHAIEYKKFEAGL